MHTQQQSVPVLASNMIRGYHENDPIPLPLKGEGGRGHPATLQLSSNETTSGCCSETSNHRH
eukprot:67378-Amphidinium_carterae.2